VIAVTHCARRRAHEVDVLANYRRGIRLRFHDRPAVTEYEGNHFLEMERFTARSRSL